MSANNITYETLAQHASDLIHWIEGSGSVLQESRPLTSGIGNNLDIKLISAPLKLDPANILLADRTPSDLSLTHKPVYSWKVSISIVDNKIRIRLLIIDCSVRSL